MFEVSAAFSEFKACNSNKVVGNICLRRRCG